MSLKDFMCLVFGVEAKGLQVSYLFVNSIDYKYTRIILPLAAAFSILGGSSFVSKSVIYSANNEDN